MDNRRVDTKRLRRRRFQGPQKTWKRLRQIFKPLEDMGYMRYRKVLGFGGFGIVQLWDLYNPDGTYYRSVAIKSIVKPDSASCTAALRREIWWAKQFTGSEHLVQLVHLDPTMTHMLDINDEDGDGPQPIMVMEHIGKGSLTELLQRLEVMRVTNEGLPEDQRGMEYIPNRTLWRIFLCLIRACIGMAYPRPFAEFTSGLLVRETLQGQPREVGPARIIHSDIDPQNIFVQAPNNWAQDPEHYETPIVKIGDYGCMTHWDDNWPDEVKYHSIWGKPAYQAPEQLHPNYYIPGVMGSQTNVYQIGAVMHDLITLQYIPFTERSVRNRRIADGLLEFNTYGWRLLNGQVYVVEPDWRKTDLELRELVAGCMAFDVEWRPQLDQLEDLVMRRLQRIEMQSAEAKRGLNPLSAGFVPGQPPRAPVPAVPYRERVEMGHVEPDALIQKFYAEYFVDAWNERDKYAGYWSKRTLTPEPSRTPTPPPPPASLPAARATA
ncbi:kinase-like protein [Nemania sp. NC0429]|nr:kinase-like protein [Nemania sp. NC0429]